MIAMSGKPFHKQHDALIRNALRECDTVHVYVSLADRKRPGEITVLGTDMEQIWHELIEPSLPANVVVKYTNAPVNAIWAEMGRAKDAGSPDVFVIYGDAKDLGARFGEAALRKYVGPLHAAGQVVLRVTSAADAALRGTDVRRALGSGDFAFFKDAMPSWMNAHRAWNILTHSVAEELLRQFVRTTVRTPS